MMVRYPERNAESRERVLAVLEQEKAKMAEEGFINIVADAFLNANDAEIEITGEAPGA